MNVALFETRAEADGFRELLDDVAGVESVVVPAPREGGFAVDVLRPADFAAGVVYLLYYVKGITLDDLPRRPRDERVELLQQHLVHYAIGERTWDPPSAGLRWYAARAELDEPEVGAAVAAAERAFREQRGRPGLLARLFGGRRRSD